VVRLSGLETRRRDRRASGVEFTVVRGTRVPPIARATIHTPYVDLSQLSYRWCCRLPIVSVVCRRLRSLWDVARVVGRFVEGVCQHQLDRLTS
jgi:hypothetical protein